MFIKVRHWRLYWNSYSFLISTTSGTCPTHLIVIALITLETLDEIYRKLILATPLLFNLLRPNILGSSLLNVQYTPKLSSAKWEIRFQIHKRN